ASSLLWSAFVCRPAAGDVAEFNQGFFKGPSLAGVMAFLIFWRRLWENSDDDANHDTTQSRQGAEAGRAAPGNAPGGAAAGRHAAARRAGLRTRGVDYAPRPMFVGHFALGFAGKRAVPQVPLFVLFLAAQLADTLWPVLIALGVERVRIEQN